MVLQCVVSFHQFFGHLEAYTRKAHVQSTLTGPIQTHFADLAFFLKTTSQEAFFGSICEACVSSPLDQGSFQKEVH